MARRSLTFKTKWLFVRSSLRGAKRRSNPFLAAALLDCFASLAMTHLVGRQQWQGVQINAQPDHHADAGGGVSVMPGDAFAQSAADERRQERAEIDADIEDRIGAVAARIAGRVEAANLGRDVRLEAAAAENERQQREQKKLLDRHHEMAERHQGRADDHCAALAEHAIGDKPAEDRGEIDEPGIETPDLRGQRLHVERAEYRFQCALEREKADHAAGMVRKQQILGHVEHEQRAHAVIGKALPHFGGEQEGQPARMAEQFNMCGNWLR
jgi:hypothetical protein